MRSQWVSLVARLIVLALISNVGLSFPVFAAPAEGPAKDAQAWVARTEERPEKPAEELNRSPAEPTDPPATWWQTIQGEIERSEYTTSWQEQIDLPVDQITAADMADGAYHAPNRAHNLRVYFSPQGPVVVPRLWPETAADAPWHWGVRLATHRRGVAGRSVGAAAVEAAEHRVSYRREGVTEWYVNDERGLEQGFTLSQRLAGPSNAELVLELEIVGNLSPALDASSGAIDFFTGDGVPVLRYDHLHVIDVTGRTLPSRLALQDSHILIRVDDRAAVYPITIDPLLTRPGWEVTGTGSFGSSAASAGDVNGDGFDDVIVGASAYDNGQGDEGQALLYLGSAAGLSTTPAWTVEGDQAGAELGIAVGTAGDVDGDGFDDVIVGASHYAAGGGTLTAAGWAAVYAGSSAGLSAAPVWIAEGDQAEGRLGCAVGTAGDVNGDGYADVIVGAYSYDSFNGLALAWYGSATGLGANGTPGNADWSASGADNAHYGAAVGTAGDVDGDGYDDVLVGAYLHATVGRVEVFHGSATGLAAGPADWYAQGTVSNGDFGNAAGTAGDVNGDGYADIIVGANEYTSFGKGQAYVWHGSATGLGAAGTPANADWSAAGSATQDAFGKQVGTAGDVDGDGYDDVLIGAPFAESTSLEADEGRVFLYHGSPEGLKPFAGWIGENDQAGAWLGYVAATAGDVNGDGFDDVIVTTWRYDLAYVYYGSPFRPSRPADLAIVGDQASSRLGWSVHTAGDWNGDTYDDVLVGAPYYDNGQANEGRIYIYPGSATGLLTTTTWITESNSAEAKLGIAVSTAGDVNGDGYDDVIAGASEYRNGQHNEGAVYVFHGSASGAITTTAWFTESGTVAARMGSAVSTAGDVNDDGFDDVIIRTARGTYPNLYGRALVYHGSPTGLGLHPAWEVEAFDSAYAQAVSTAGDVNHDGFDDVVVGWPTYNGMGAVHVYFGATDGLTTTVGWSAESDQSGSSFGKGVAGAGDVNGDGFADLVVGAPSYDLSGSAVITDGGAAFVWHGSTSGLGAAGTPANADWAAYGDQVEGKFGSSVAGVGDTDGDGRDDVMVGTGEYRDPYEYQGRVFAYAGSPSGLGSTHAWEATVTQQWAFFGKSVGPAGDVDGDGYADVVVGADSYGWPSGALYPDRNGALFIYYGQGWIGGLNATNDGPTPAGFDTTLAANVSAGTRVSYQWAFGDGALESGRIVTHTYPTSGIYTAVVTASNALTEATASTAVTVYDVMEVTPGGTPVTTTDGTLQLEGAAQLTSSLTFVYTPLDPASAPAGGDYSVAGIYFGLDAADELGNPVGTFTPPLTMTVHYDPAGIPWWLEPSLSVYRWNESAALWEPLTVLARDPAADLLVVALDHLTDFALLQPVPNYVYLPLVLME